MIDNHLADIGTRIDLCVCVIHTSISLSELAEFEQYLTEQDTLMPLLQTTYYMKGGDKQLDLARQRLNALKNLLEIKKQEHERTQNP